VLKPEIYTTQFYVDIVTIEKTNLGGDDQLLQSFMGIKNAELRGCILKLIGNVNKRAK
jgi:hypothetical protein